MKPRDYCCCAIPIVNAGIYATLLEQFTLGIVAGTLSVATPSIVGAVTFSAAKWVFAIICYAGAVVQLLGFIGVFQERSIMYRRYTTLHLLITMGAFSVAAVWIALSASRHNQAKSQCETDFFSGTTQDSQADTLCNIFPWVSIGLMGGLWVVLAIAQTYFYVVISSYGAGQRLDHEKYDSMGDSVASVDTIMGDKPQYPQYGNTTYQPAEPNAAYTQEPYPTPGHRDTYYNDAPYNPGSSTQRPVMAQPHPAEGSFRRKTPRLQKPMSEDYRIPY